ncbi:hypothetical protein CP532_2396 [Ophiocordyceps camponoti-leonardi (nom. inval.)]|nr:hypothetical protein CP532_2396 [Ophiocordyceps camponoti-leonardi (nom. inval.)]
MGNRWSSCLLLLIAAWLLLLQPSAVRAMDEIPGRTSGMRPFPSQLEPTQDFYVVFHGRDFAPSRLRSNGGINTMPLSQYRDFRGLQYSAPLFRRVLSDEPLQGQGSWAYRISSSPAMFPQFWSIYVACDTDSDLPFVLPIGGVPWSQIRAYAYLPPGSLQRRQGRGRAFFFTPAGDVDWIFLTDSFDVRWQNHGYFSGWWWHWVTEATVTTDEAHQSNRYFMDQLLGPENRQLTEEQRAELLDLYHWNLTDPGRGRAYSVIGAAGNWTSFNLSSQTRARLYAGLPTLYDCRDALVETRRRCREQDPRPPPSKFRRQEMDSCELLADVMMSCEGESAGKSDAGKADDSKETCGILPRTSFTANQWSKGDGLSRCVGCVHGHHSDAQSAAQSDSGRYNKSAKSVFTNYDLDNPFAQGAFRWVAKGEYVSGPRRGEPCVAKWFKTGAVFSHDYFALDIKAVDKALEMVNVFNQMKIVNKAVKINVPAVWRFDDDCPDGRAGQNNLCEPFIHNYQKFNSNTGWTDDSEAWGEVMQALSHFSYHLSGGNYVLCDLQGGIYRHEVVLSDPVILSRNREYGVTDLGSDGISSFFSQHDCNDFCRPNWTQPANPVPYFRPVPGTTMIRRSVQTRSSRPAGTRGY